MCSNPDGYRIGMIFFLSITSFFLSFILSFFLSFFLYICFFISFLFFALSPAICCFCLKFKNLNKDVSRILFLLKDSLWLPTSSYPLRHVNIFLTHMFVIIPSLCTHTVYCKCVCLHWCSVECTLQSLELPSALSGFLTFLPEDRLLDISLWNICGIICF